MDSHNELTSYNQRVCSNISTIANIKNYINRSYKRKTRSISETTIEVDNNKIDNNDVQLIKQLTTIQKIQQLTNKLTINLITKLSKLYQIKLDNNNENRIKYHHNVYNQNYFIHSNNYFNTSPLTNLFCQLIIIILISNFNGISGAIDDRALSNQQHNAPFFTNNNFPSKIAFYNTTGTHLNCPVSGNPKPIVHWLQVGSNNGQSTLNSKTTNYHFTQSITKRNSFNYPHWSIDGLDYHQHYQQPNLPTQNLYENVLTSNPELSPIIDLNNLIYTRNDGSLVFSPFHANDLQPNIHNRKYRCLAINEYGALLSNEIQVKGLIYQPYEIRVYDEFVVRDSVGVLRCQIPAFILDHVTINCWIRSDGLIIRKSSNEDPNSRYLMFDTGELHSKQVVKEDEKYSFRCEITDQLIGQTLISSTSGHFVITESSNSIAPRFLHRKPKVRSSIGNTVYLPCAVQANPKAKISWFNETSALNTNLNNLDLTRTRILQDGTLIINNLRLTDSGSYKCLATNSLGEEATLVQLQVLAPLNVNINGGNGKIVSSAIGASLLLNCTVKGQANQISWYRNGIHINPGRTLSTSNNLLSDTTDLIHESTSSLLANKFKLIDGMSLLINSIDTSDQALYQCMAIRDLDQQQAQASIQVNIISKFPVLIKVPQNISVEQNQQVSLHCAAQGTPLPQILWSSYGETLQEKSNIRIGDFVSSDGAVHSFVNLSNLDSQEGGLYTCSAKNFLGQVTVSAFISVKSVAPYVKVMRNLTALASSSFLIQCPYSAYGPVTLNWFKGKRRLPLNRRQTVFSNGTLLVENLIREEDEGEYRCQVQDEQNRIAERSVFVKILIKPSIMPFSFAPNLQEGMRASITCTVTTGDPPVSLKWLHNGRPLKNGQDQSISVVNRGSNNHHQLNEDHSNSVLSLPFHSNELIRDVFIENVDEFISTLIFRPLRQEHSGLYSCVAANQAAKVNYTVTLSVDAPPKWIIEPTDRTGVVGESISMNCQASGKPLPTTIWKKLSQTNSNGYIDLDKKSKELESSHNSNYKTLISGSRVQTLVNGTLYILEALKEDAGFYLCESSNGIGQTLSTVIKLTIHTPAHFKERYDQKKVLRNEPVQLSCTAFGEFPLKIYWAKEGKGQITANEHSTQLISTDHEGRRLSEIQNARIVEELVEDRLTSKLIINSVQREHTGLYLCTTENSFSDKRKDERHIELLVQDSPDTVESLKLVKLSSRSFQISFNSPFDGNSPIKRYLLQYKTSQDNWQSAKELSLEPSRTEAFVRNLLPMTDYELRMAVINDIGQSKWSNLLTIKTEEEVPESAPSYVHVTATGSRRLKIVWQTGKTSKGSSISGYYIGYKIMNQPSFIFKTVKLQNLNKEESNGKLTYELTNLEKQTKYIIVVQAFNVKGAGPLSSETVCSTLEFDSPAAPEVELESVQWNSVTISWQQNDLDNPVIGYIIKFKRKISTSNKIANSDYLSYPIEVQRTTTNNNSNSTNNANKTVNNSNDSDTNSSQQQTEKLNDDPIDSWLETQILNTEQTKFTINNLKCGSFYLIKVCGFNSMGRGPDSEVLQVKTKGAKPQIPDKEQLFVLNSSYLQLNLFVFSNFEHAENCPIEYLNVKYKQSNEETWANWLLSNQDQYLIGSSQNGQSINQPIRNNLVSDSNEQNSNLVSNGEFLTYHHNKNNLVPMNYPETCIINNLTPASWFNVWITVRNSAGTTDAIYKVATLTENGEFLQQQSGSTRAMLWMPFLGSISLLCVLVLTALVILYLHHRSNTVAIQYSTASIEPKSNECLALGQLTIDKSNYMNSNATYVDSCSNFATSSCSTGMHVNAYQTPNLQNCVDMQNNLQNNLQSNANLANNLTNNLILKNAAAGIYGNNNNYTTCANLVSLHRQGGSNYNLVDDVYLQNNLQNNNLQSPYASTRIQIPKTPAHDETSLKLDHQQQMIMDGKKSFSNIYDIPQQQCLQTAIQQQHQQQQQQQQHQNNQNRNNSLSIGTFMDAFVENKTDDLSELYSTSSKNRRAISQVDLFPWNSQLQTYQQQIQPTNNCQKTLSTFRKQ